MQKIKKPTSQAFTWGTIRNLLPTIGVNRSTLHIQQGSYRFQIHHLALALWMMGMYGLSQLGCWQWHRALDKEALYHQYEARSQEAPLSGAIIKAPASEEYLFRRLQVHGHFLKGKDVLLDNQLFEGRPGYRVWTPFQVADGGPLLLIGRGWIPAPPDRKTLPILASLGGERWLIGKLEQPSYNVFISRPRESEAPQWPLRIQNWSWQDLEAAFGQPLYPYTLTLPAESAYVYTRLATEPWLNAQRHRAYAYQWFALAGLLFLLTVVLQTKKVPHAP